MQFNTLLNCIIIIIHLCTSVFQMSIFFMSVSRGTATEPKKLINLFELTLTR